MAVVAPVCSTPVWPPVNVLLTSALLAPGQRTVTSVLGVRGRSAGAHGHTDHRVWNRAVWSPLGASRRLLRLVGAVFGPAGVVVLGREETIERRRGANITAQGLDRDPVRSSRAHVVNVSGRRWRCGRRLPPRSGAHRVWALPVMTGRCASAPVDEPQDRRAHTRVPQAWQLIQVVVRGRPGRIRGLCR